MPSTNPDEAPFCPKGCEHAYAHAKCASSEYPAVDPMAYEAGTDEGLLTVFSDLCADYARYAGHHGHRPTYLEAARRLTLVKTEILARMAGDRGR